jgi:pyrroloquinoline quinone biosynthesis protein E
VSTRPIPRPFTLVAELTYRCPLRCPYCSNPPGRATRRAPELATEDWQRVFAEAAGLGVVQLHLTGGEPLFRRDLVDLVAAARTLGLYVNLVTSGVPDGASRIPALAAAGLDAVQVSVQDADPITADRIAGRRAAHEEKLAVARAIKAAGLPLTINVVLHRENLAHVREIVALAETLGADRLELANTQYLGWALVNRDTLVPSASQLEAARAIARAEKERLSGRMEVIFVWPDLHGGRPRACMDGWAERFLVVSPDGLALPCQAAHTIPGFRFDDVRDRSLTEIWHSSPAFARFRGDAWMSAPCRDCPERAIDHGGCRCQAFHLTGDAAATDPACERAPRHDVVLAVRARAERRL